VPPPGGTQRKSRGPLIAAISAAALVLILTISGIAFALRSDKKEGPDTPEPAAAACGYKIAYLGILTGEYSVDGTTVRNAVQLALDKYNRAHDGCKTELVEYDTKGEADEAARLAGELARDEKVLGVVGPLWLSEAEKVMPILDAAGIPAISPTLTYTDLSKQRWKTFHRTVGTDADQGRSAARYLQSTMKARKVFIVTDNDQYATKVADEVRFGLNATFAGRADVLGNETTFAPIVGQVVGSGADTVYFSGYYDSASIFVKEMKAAKSDIKILGWDRLFTDLFIDGAGEDVAEGVAITCACVPPSDARENFANDFRERFDDAGYYSPESYDAANVLLAALGAGKSTRADVLEFVHRYNAQGVSRQIKFTSDGDLDPAIPIVWAYLVKNGGVVKDQVIV
jgi:ABC-type branched-subunit amino acid transport system substrate-binding protein